MDAPIFPVILIVLGISLWVLNAKFPYLTPLLMGMAIGVLLTTVAGTLGVFPFLLAGPGVGFHFVKYGWHIGWLWTTTFFRDVPRGAVILSYFENVALLSAGITMLIARFMNSRVMGWSSEGSGGNRATHLTPRGIGLRLLLHASLALVVGLLAILFRVVFGVPSAVIGILFVEVPLALTVGLFYYALQYSFLNRPGN